jgi:uncharacterized membrane protein
MEEKQKPPLSAPPAAPLTDAQDIQENKILALLSYISVLFLIPLLAKKDSKFCQFHAKQGLVLFLVSLIGMIPIVGWLIAPLLGLVIFIISIIGIIKVLQGEYWKIPVVSDYAEKINI